VVQSRSGRVHDRPGQLQYVVDFALPEGVEAMPDLSVSGAEALGLSAYRLAPRGHLRTGFRLAPGAAEAAEVRLVLRDAAGRPLSDVWLHRWTRARDGGV
jgi:Periplasmic glucans biosynthesis protein